MRSRKSRDSGAGMTSPQPIKDRLSGISILDSAQPKSALELKIAGLDVKIGETQADMIKWVAGLMVAQGAAIVALVKFLPGFHS